jgi:hypothetical protein
MSDTFTAAESPSPFRRFVKFAFFGILALILLSLLLAGFENWRGRRAWEKFRTEWEARGEQFDMAAFIPKPVPPEQNFAMTPLLAPLLDYDRRNPAKWRDPAGRDRANAVSGALGNYPGRKAPPPGNWQTATLIDLHQWQDYFVGHTNYPSATNSGSPARDVLSALRKFDPELEELSAAAARPYSVFPIHYEEHINALLPHLATLKGISQLVRLRALARLGVDDKAGAFQDVKLGLRLTEAASSEPITISHLVRIASVQIIMQPVWEGLARHQWTEEQLAELQSALANIRVLEAYGLTIRGERAFSNLMIDEMRSGKHLNLSDVLGNGEGQMLSSASRLVPSGWFYQNQLTLNRLYQERCLPLVDTTKHRVYAQQTREADDVPELKSRGLYNIFARLLFPAIAKLSEKFANGQTTVDLATVACALERHRLATGQYPEQLDLLVPRFIAKIPTDVITGELLKYRREPDGTFVLYSVGWNETDDGGEPGVTKSGTAVDPNQGDWVWRYPPKP